MIAAHIVSDWLVAVAYFAIPLTLYYFTRRRKDFPFPKILISFGIFIVCCGLTHVGNILELWVPWYGLTACVKLMTAVASWVTYRQLRPLIPQLLRLPGLAEINTMRDWMQRSPEQILHDMTNDRERIAKVQVMVAELDRIKTVVAHFQPSVSPEDSPRVTR